MKFSSEKPIYRQIVDLCYEHILADQWICGEKIPSVRDLAGALMVNVNTVAKAYDYMEARGIISSQRSTGHYLDKEAKDKIVNDRRTEFFDATLPEIFKTMELLDISLKSLADQYSLYKIEQTEAQKV